MIRFVPGLVAAIAAFVVLKLISWVESQDRQFLIYLVTYGVAAVAVDAALKRYGQPQV